LQETVRHPIHDPSIRKIIERVRSEHATDRARIEALLTFVSTQIEDSLTQEPLTVQDVLQTRKGDCTEHALLFTTLARALGIPTRQVHGLAYMGDDVQAFGLHEWNEVVLEERWHAVDPTFQEFDINPTHIRFGLSSQIDAVRNFFGDYRFELVTVQNAKSQRNEPDGLRQSFSIGDKGASLQLGPSWTRRKIDQRLGDDQFIHGNNYIMAIFEIEEALGDEAAFTQVVDRFLELLKAKTSNADVEVSQFEGTHEIGKISARVSTDVSGVAFDYRISLIGKHGLNYVILAWAPTASTGFETEFKRIANSLRFPAPDSPWGLKAQITRASFRYGNQRIGVPYRPSLFERVEREDALLKLQSLDEIIDISFYVSEGYDTPESAMTDDRDYFQSILATYKQVYTESLDFNNRSILFAGGKAYDQEWVAIQSAYFPLPDRTFLEIRMMTMGEDMAHRVFLEQVVAGLEVQDSGEIDAFPVVEETEEPVGICRSWPGEAEKLGEIPGYAFSFTWHAEKAWAITSNQVICLDPNRGESKVVVQSEEHDYRRRIGTYRGQIVFNSSDYSIRTAGPQQKLLPLKAKAVIQLDQKRHLMVPADEMDHRFDYFGQASPGLDTLVLYGKNDQPRDEIVLPGSWVAGSSSKDGREFLAATQAPWFDAERTVRLSLLRIRGLKTRNAISWQTVRHIANTDDAWLVSGRPLKGADGVYRVDFRSDPEFLIGGEDLVGLAQADGSLILAARDPSYSSYSVYRLPLPVETQGWPIDVTWLNRIADMLAPSALHSAEDIRDLVTQADRTMHDTYGATLPRDTKGFDALLSFMGDSTQLSRSGLILLTAMLTQILMDNGATWLPSAVDLDSLPMTIHAYENAFATLHDPSYLVWSSLFESEGWWDPASSVLDLAQGRAVLLSCDPDIARSHAGDLIPEGLPEIIANQDAQHMAQIILEHKSNEHFRTKLYLQLLVENQNLAQRTVEAVLSQSPELELEQTYAMTFRAIDTDRPQDLAQELRDSIARHPKQAIFYHLLADEYAASSDPDDIDRARACYIKLLQLRPWGTFAERAQAWLNDNP